MQYSRHASKGKIDNLSQQAIINSVQILLRQTASLMRNAKFVRWFKTDTTRFAWDSTELHAKLRSIFSYQLNSAVNKRFELSFDESLIAFADLCDAVADSFIERYELKRTVADGRFSFQRDGNKTIAIYNLMKKRKYLFYSFLPKCEIYHNSDFFLVRNVISELELYVKSRMTLEHDTGNVKFEKILADLNPKTDYFLSGYPFDLFAIDAELVREKHPCYGIAINKNYCSTKWIDPLNHDDNLFHILNENNWVINHM